MFHPLRLPRDYSVLVLVAASAVFACRLLLALAIIPPWQQPDEPTHVALLELQRNRIALLDGLPDPGREAEILQSMAHYDWWEHRAPGFPVPATIPTRFDSAGPRTVVPVIPITKPTLYFRIVARVLGWLPSMSVVDDLYVVRAISALFGMLTLWVAWLAARACLGAAGGAMTAVLLALHPQFAIVSTTAAPDALVNLLGACLWWLTALALRGTRVVLALAGVWLAAIAGATSDRLGMPLLAIAFIVSIVVVMRGPVRRRKAFIVAPITAVVAGAILMSALWTVDQSQNTFSWRYLLASSWMPVPHAMTWEFFAGFASFVHQSWWFSLGWVRYPPPSWWAMIAIGLTAVAATGAGYRIFRASDLDAPTRTFLILGAIGIVIQLGAVYWAYFRVGNGAQGRALFPLLVPCLMLIWTGVEAWVPQSFRLHAAAALALVFAFLDVTVWGLVALPVYYAGV